MNKMQNIKPLTECWSFVGSTPNKFEGEKRYISTGALDKDHINEIDVERVTFDNRPSRANLEVSAGDILFAKMASTEKTFIVDEVSEQNIYSTGFCAVRAKENIILPKCLYYFLSSTLFLEQKDKNSSGATQKAITNSGLSKIYINLPNLTEQQEFIAQMDSLSTLITARREQLAKLDEFVKSRFIELFGDPVTNPMGWELHRFDSLCENLDSQRKPITASEREAGIYPYYGASGIVDYVADYLFDEDILLVSEDGANLLMRSTPIAFSVSGKVWVNNHAHVVRFETMSMQKYIEVFFSLIDISDQITGSAQPKLNQAKLNAMMFPVPSDERLGAFLQVVEQTDKSKLAIQQSLKNIENLKKALMPKYFG